MDISDGAWCWALGFLTLVLPVIIGSEAAEIMTTTS
jgi:hypothetical protein